MGGLEIQHGETQYGLKDAPRAWGRKLDLVLRSWEPPVSSARLKPLMAAPDVYMAHAKGKTPTARLESVLASSSMLGPLAGSLAAAF